MTALCFDHSDGTICQLAVSEVALPRSIEAQRHIETRARFKVHGLRLNLEESELEQSLNSPLFFEWQQLEWLFEPGAGCRCEPPLALFINGVHQKRVKSRTLHGQVRLTGTTNLENSVGLTRFEIRDANGKLLFALDGEVFPQKLDYKDDFPAMLDEITEILYSLAFDAFTKTFASTRPRSTYHQLTSEWLNLFKALYHSLEQSLDTLLRSPKSELSKESRVKPIHRVKRATPRAIKSAAQRPDRFCRGGGLHVAPGVQLSHLTEQHKRISYDTQENRFIAWAISDILRQIQRAVRHLNKGRNLDNQRVKLEIEALERSKSHLRRRLRSPVLAEVSTFNHQMFFSTTLTMAPGYKEFYHRFLLLRKGLTMAEHPLFKMDYKDIATIYEYWCFLKTVKLLRENPKYDLAGNDIVKLEHHRFKVNLKKGKKSAVNFVQRSTGDGIAIYFNRSFPRKDYTYTFDQKPDQFIEFSRSGFGSSRDKKSFKVIMDAKYRFDRGSKEYPGGAGSTPYGPPLDTIAQLHRYRDAILWEDKKEQQKTVKMANKSIGGVILFPYPEDEQDFVAHPFYQSIEKVNIGAIPLQPGRVRKNRLFQAYLDSLFEQPGEVITESFYHYDDRAYQQRRQSNQDLVMVGLVPQKQRDARLKYHFEQQIFYTQRHKSSNYPLHEVKSVALYDQQERRIIGWANVLNTEILLGNELEQTGTHWKPSKPNQPYYVYHLEPIKSANLRAGGQMKGNRTGRYFITRLGLQVALQEQVPELQFLSSWEQFIEWKTLKTRHSAVRVERQRRIDASNGQPVDDLEFIVEKDVESS
ncbi:restriction endonuclease-like protein [Halomonas sp. BLK-85]